MRTLLVTSSFPPQIGGVETYMAEVADALAGEDLHVIAPVASGQEIVDRGMHASVHRYDREVHTRSWPGAFRQLRGGLEALDGRDGGWAAAFPRPGTAMALGANRHMLLRAAAQSAALRWAANGSPPGAVLAATALPSGALARLISERTGAPYGIFAHAAELLVEGARLRALLRRVLGGAAAIGAVSRYTRRLVVDLGVVPDRIQLTPPGIDASRFLDPPSFAAVREQLGLAGRRVILTHGRLDPRKGIDMVIRALPDVLRQVPEAVYVVTGFGRIESELRELAAREGVADRVRFAGALAAPDLPALLHSTDVFVMASRQIGGNVEGFGIVCLEAAAAGVPVLAGRSGGVADAIADGETGYLVDPEDPGDIARRLVALLADPVLARRMGAAGRERVLEEFDRRAFAARTRRLLAAVAGAGAGARG